jgi:hypothetical protein
MNDEAKKEEGTQQGDDKYTKEVKLWQSESVYSRPAAMRPA